MTKTQLGTLGVGIILLAVTLRYAFFQPFIPSAINDAIPVHATFVHHAESVEELLKGPVCEPLNQALGAGNSIENLLTSHHWFYRLVPNQLAVVNLPLRHAGENKTWVIVSWIGWRSPWLRWKFEGLKAEGFSSMGKHSVWPIWKYESPKLANGTPLTFTLTDNLFIACLSNNPANILAFLDTYDNHVPSINDLKTETP